MAKSNKNYKKIAKEIRKKVLDMIYKAQTSHIGSNLSCIDILTVLYFGIMKPEDKFILSKGWAAASVYAILTKKGYFPQRDLEGYCKINKKGKPVTPFIGLISHKAKGVTCSTGSMGHGLPIGVGMALAKKLNNKKGRIFVLMSDGEMDCGTTWESALFASHHRLDNLVVLIDYNKWQAFGRTNEVLNLEPLKEKWISFGWAVKEIDGHNYSEIEKVLSKLPFKKNQPSIIIAHTIKGKGVSFMENKLEWHYKPPTKEDYEKAIAELEKNIC
jgi:transketolase